MRATRKALVAPTNQQAFSRIVRGLAKQRWKKCMDKQGNCSTNAGKLSCAIGQLGDGTEKNNDRVVAKVWWQDHQIPEPLASIVWCHDTARNPLVMRTNFLILAETKNFNWPRDVRKTGKI